MALEDNIVVDLTAGDDDEGDDETEESISQNDVRYVNDYLSAKSMENGRKKIEDVWNGEIDGDEKKESEYVIDNCSKSESDNAVVESNQSIELDYEICGSEDEDEGCNNGECTDKGKDTGNGNGKEKGKGENEVEVEGNGGNNIGAESEIEGESGDQIDGEQEGICGDEGEGKGMEEFGVEGKGDYKVERQRVEKAGSKNMPLPKVLCSNSSDENSGEEKKTSLSKVCTNKFNDSECAESYDPNMKSCCEKVSEKRAGENETKNLSRLDFRKGASDLTCEEEENSSLAKKMHSNKFDDDHSQNKCNPDNEDLTKNDEPSSDTKHYPEEVITIEEDSDEDDDDGDANVGHADNFRHNDVNGHAASQDDADADQQEIKRPINERAKVPLHHVIEITDDSDDDIVFVGVDKPSAESRKRERDPDSEMARVIYEQMKRHESEATRRHGWQFTQRHSFEGKRTMWYNDREQQERMQQEQERLLRESAIRLQLREQHLLYGQGALTEPVKDLSSLPANHWKLPNLYARLGLPHNSHFSLVKKHYRKLCLLYHPDKAKVADAAIRFQGIKEAYETISERCGA